MEDNVKEEGGISVADIFRTIFSQKWLALIIAAVITIAGTIGLYFYNKTKAYYSVTFVMQLPGSGNSPMNYTYPDGTRFHFTEIVSADNLEKVKKQSADKEIDEFSGIDVEKMLQNGDISIIRELLETAEGSGTYEANYTVRASSKYFKSKEVARDFIIALIQLPGDHLSEMQIDYGTQLTSAEKSITFDDQLSFLQAQVNELASRYDSFISSYGSNFVVENGKTLTAYRSELSLFLRNSSIDNLKSEVLTKYYIKSEAALNKYKNDLELKNRDLKKEQATLDNLLSINIEQGSSQTSIVIDSAQIKSQSQVVENLKEQIADLEKFRDNGVTSGTEYDNFVKRVGDLESEIRELTEEFKTVAACVYSTATTINYSDANIIVTEGSSGIIKCFILSLVAGVVVALIVAYIVGWSKNRKKAAVAEAKPLPVFSEAQAQAAVTKDEDTNTDEKQ